MEVLALWYYDWDDYRKVDVMIDDCFSYYDIYESGMTSSGDRKHQYQRTDIMICQTDVSPVSTTRFAFSPT